MAKTKFYVVWKGRKTGIFASWPECEAEVKGFVGAQYKSFETRKEAEAGLLAGYQKVAGKPSTSGRWKTAEQKPVLPSVCVDAACAGAPGPVEYRAVDTGTGKQLFHAGPYKDGTNNVGEFLAIVRALAWLTKNNSYMPVYSDSESAIAWIKARRCRTKLERTASNATIFALIASAEKWLAENQIMNGVIKWDTEKWGENPADFGRK
jgi:ribonuclease HI